MKVLIDIFLGITPGGAQRTVQLLMIEPGFLESLFCFVLVFVPHTAVSWLISDVALQDHF